MTNDSTPTFKMTDSESVASKSPRKSSILYVQQFARVYMSVGSNNDTMLIVN